MITYCIPTYKSLELCRLSIEAVMRGTLKPELIAVCDNTGTGAAAEHLKTTMEKYPVGVFVQDHNIGVAAAWNAFMQIGRDYTVIANDDIEVHTHTLQALHSAADINKNEVFFTGSSTSGNSFSLFLLKQKGYEKIGPFDEKFYPAYFEDNDYSRRISLLGYQHIFVEDATYEHVGSSTFKAYNADEQQEHHKAFRKNRTYYTWKWGGMPHEETLTEPRSI